MNSDLRNYIPFEQKRIGLLKYLIALEFGVEIFYVLLHFALSLHVSWWIYGGFLLLTFIQFALFRMRLINFLIPFTLVSFNLAVFATASSESHNTGLYLHFISAASAALALAGYEERLKGIFFTALSLFLFLIIHLTDVQILPYRSFSLSQEKIFFIVNTVTMTIGSATCVVLLLKVNFDFERSLIKNQTVNEQQNEELMKANSELDRFVYSASHDLRAPLSSITGLLGLAKTADQASIEEYMGLIQNRVDAMEKFIGEITDYSRNSRMEVEYKPIHLKSQVYELWDSMHFIDGSNRVQLILDKSLDTTVCSDPYRIRIILNNLIVNSIKYANTKAESFVKVSSWRADGMVFVRVEDNGIGIEHQYRGRVFEMFYRATEISRGSGLGLYIVMEAVKKLKGNITLHSEHANGTSISFSFPDNG